MDRALQIDTGISKVEDGINQVNTEGICEGYTRKCLDIDLAWPASTHAHTDTWVFSYAPHAVKASLRHPCCGALKVLDFKTYPLVPSFKPMALADLTALRHQEKLTESYKDARQQCLVLRRDAVLVARL